MKCPFCIKVCSECGRLLVAYEGNFVKEKTGKYGFRADCKRCRNEKKKQWYREQKEKKA